MKVTKSKIDDFLNKAPLGGALLICLIMISIVSYALETEFKESFVLKITSTFVALVFGVEYALRVWSSSIQKTGRLGYIFSFYGIIDLIAFLPARLIPAAGGGILLRVLRRMRLAQILKIKPVRKALLHFKLALSKAKADLIVSFAFSAFLIFIGAVTMFYVEGRVQPEAFGSIPRALWWSVATLTTVGYGDVYPITSFGKILASVMALVGIAAVAMPAGILAAAFTSVTGQTPDEN